MLEIKPSPIEGYGVFAGVDIPKGTSIGYFTGEEITWKEFYKRYRNDPDKWVNVYRMPFKGIIDAKDPKYKAENIILWVNDGEHGQRFSKYKPNAFLSKRFLITERDIEKGEEILISYGKSYWKSLGT